MAIIKDIVRGMQVKPIKIRREECNKTEPMINGYYKTIRLNSLLISKMNKIYNLTYHSNEKNKSNQT